MAGEIIVRVRGLRELERAFARADRAVRNDLRDALEEAAQPVRADAQNLAAVRIRNVAVGSPWSRMRIGSHRSVVYVAPVERGIKSRGLAGRRRGQGTGPPSFADLMMDRAMEPALAQNVRQVEQRIDHMLGEVIHVWEARP